MLISAVEPKKKGLSALYIDGEFAMKLDTETLLSFRFDVGRDVSDEELHEVILASGKKRCKDKAMWLLSFRDHTEKELRDKLKKDYDEEAIDATITRIKELGLINDESYARRYASDLFSIKRLSRSGAKQKMLQKGIDRDLIDTVLEEFDVDDEDQLRALFEKKYARSLSDEKGRRRAFNALMRLGFSAGDIKRVMRDFLEDFED